jgi:elongation factor Ts
MAVDAKTVKALRDKTGAPILHCREALEKNDCNIEKAITYLREKGIASASKKMGRDTKDGKIISYIHPGDKLGVMVEINCETDFVAKGDGFTEFARDIAMHIAAANPVYVSKEEVPEDVLEKERQIYRTQAQNSNKPEKVIEKIIEGKLGKFYSEVCLLEQAFVKDDKVIISDFMKSAIAKFGGSIGVSRFARFKLGDS